MTHSHAGSVRAVSPIEITLIFTAFIASGYGFGIYLFATLAAEIRSALDLDYGTVGLATGFAQGGFLVASLLSGAWAPRFGAARVILMAVGATGISLLLMSRLPASNPSIALIALLTVMGAGAAAVWVPMVAIMQEVVPLRHRAKALGLLSSGTSYGVFLNGVIVPPLMGLYGWRSIWLVVGCLATLLLAIGYWRLRGLGTLSSAAPAASTMSVPGAAGFRFVRQPLALVLIATMFLNGLVCMPFQTYLAPLLQEDLGQTVAIASRIWSVIGVVGMASGFLLGLLADRISIKWAMVVTYFLLLGATLTILVVAWIEWPVLWAMLGAGILFSLAFYAIFGLVPAYISTTFQGADATLLFGVGNIALGLGGLLGNLVGGYTRELTGSFLLIYSVIAVAAAVQIGLALVTPSERRLNRPDRS